MVRMDRDEEEMNLWRKRMERYWWARLEGHELEIEGVGARGGLSGRREAQRPSTHIEEKRATGSG